MIAKALTKYLAERLWQTSNLIIDEVPIMSYHNLFIIQSN